LFNAELKKGSSYTWLSIWAGIQTFKKGYIWRVGDGEDINIWDDPWISSSPSRKILTPRGRIVYTKVSKLIDLVTRTWDEVLIRSLIFSVDVNRILEILLAVGMMEDFVSWNYTKNVIFSVRSAYFVECDHQHGRKLIRTNVMGTSDINLVWSQVWKLKVSAKIKIFA
jgi:hypothetical protein